MKILIALKVNLLALLSIPLLLISMCAKLLAKAMEKATIFFGVGIAILLLMLLREIINNFRGFLESIGFILAFLIVFGGIVLLVVMIIVLAGTVVTIAIAAVVGAVIAASDAIFRVAHSGYSKLYDICKSDYNRLKTEKRRIIPAVTCILWSFLKALNFCIIKIFSFSFPISIAASVGFLGVVVWSVHDLLSKMFGIGVFTYLGLFSAVEVVFTILYFAVFVIGTVIVLISLGIEWGEWGKLLDTSTLNYQEYRRIAMKHASELGSGNVAEYSFEKGKDVEQCQRSMGIFREMLEGAENLLEQVDAALSIKDDSALAYDRSEYLTLLGEIAQKLSTFKSEIPCDVFKRDLMPLISRAEALLKRTEKNAQNIIMKFHKNTSNDKGMIDFFAGCADKDEVRRRYIGLSKVYHPDVGGNHEIFTTIQNQYEALMSKE